MVGRSGIELCSSSFRGVICKAGNPCIPSAESIYDAVAPPDVRIVLLHTVFRNTQPLSAPEAIYCYYFIRHMRTWRPATSKAFLRGPPSSDSFKIELA